MNDHHYYESLIFSDEPLDDSERKSLADHLESCESCRGLQEGWESCASLFMDAQAVSPASGFVDRWDEHYQQKRAEETGKTYRRFFWGALILLTTVCAFSIILMADPGNMVRGISFFNSVFSTLAGVRIQFRTLISIIRTPLLIVGVGAISLSMTIALFGFLFYKKSENVRQGVHNND